MRRKYLHLIGLLALAASCSGNGDSLEMGYFVSYRNPVAQLNIPDPSLVKADGSWLVFASETDASVVPTYISSDLLSWTEVDPVFDEETRPTFIRNAKVESPEIVSLGDGSYLLYYTLKAKADSSGIGVATATAVSGPWTDHGEVIRKKDVGVNNIEHPSFIQDDGVNYLVFGGGKGVYVARLSADGLTLDKTSSLTRIAGDEVDAPSIVKHGPYYYLIASVGVTTGGASCPCLTVMGRSDSLFGPYLNKGGESMLDGKYDILIEHSTKFRGPGHVSQLTTDDDGNIWLLYNSYDLTAVSAGRTLMLDKVTWENDWPEVRGAVGSFCANVPVVNQ